MGLPVWKPPKELKEPVQAVLNGLSSRAGISAATSLPPTSPSGTSRLGTSNDLAERLPLFLN